MLVGNLCDLVQPQDLHKINEETSWKITDISGLVQRHKTTVKRLGHLIANSLFILILPPALMAPKSNVTKVLALNGKAFFLDKQCLVVLMNPGNKDGPLMGVEQVVPQPKWCSDIRVSLQGSVAYQKRATSVWIGIYTRSDVISGVIWLNEYCAKWLQFIR